MKLRVFNLKTIVSLLLLSHFSCAQVSEKATSTEKSTSKEHNVTSDDIPVLDYDGLEPYLKKKNDTTYVVNFWATWCKPCVEELPYFLELNEKYKAGKFKMLLVSLDFPKQLEKKVVPFINERKIEPDVLLLDDPDANSWIDKISPEWSGAIPATIIYNEKKSAFYEKSFESLEELQSLVTPFLK